MNYPDLLKILTWIIRQSIIIFIAALVFSFVAAALAVWGGVGENWAIGLASPVAILAVYLMGGFNFDI